MFKFKKVFLKENNNLESEDKVKHGHFPPARAIVFGFALLILLGAILLSLPFSVRPGQEQIRFIDSLFTATSAVCVTGLVVVDTNTAWSAFGQVVIILLIQIGGLGIMTFATLFSLFLGRHIGLKERLAIQESLNEFSLSGMVRIIKRILIATFAIEFIGAAMISTRLIPLYGFGEGIAKSLFHSISSFCNAGFDIFGSADNKFISLVSFQQDPVMLITTTVLIITGGLGFIVWKDIIANKKFSSFILHTKVVLITTLVLIVSGTLLLYVFESNNKSTLANLPTSFKLLNSYFHSVTPRTAGFNSLSVGELTEPSKLLTILLMFIGAAPGSTAGGIKVTTFTLLIWTALSYIKGDNDVNLLNRRIPNTVIIKSFCILMLSLTLIFTTTMVLLINKDGTLMQVLFETVSAFGTVGLSTGITPTLCFSSKLMIILTMFFGRVGPLSAAITISTAQKHKNQPYRFPEGKIGVG